MAQPNKGDRIQVMTRIPARVAVLFRADAKRRGTTYSELMAAIAAEYYGMSGVLPIPPLPPEDEHQKELPMTG